MNEQPQPRWYVTGQQPTTAPDERRNFVEGVRVLFQTDFGAADSVFLPNTQYTPDNVKAAIEERYQRMLGVQGLTG